jgi:hypothetical protein
LAGDQLELIKEEGYFLNLRHFGFKVTAHEKQIKAKLNVLRETVFEFIEPKIKISA